VAERKKGGPVIKDGKRDATAWLRVCVLVVVSKFGTCKQSVGIKKEGRSVVVQLSAGRCVPLALSTLVVPLSERHGCSKHCTCK
jgi:hypothetical protein